jgi:FMN phosphatase YigB (HAD superfamily)
VLRVAFDLDGTLADMQQVLRREAAKLFPSARPLEKVTPAVHADTHKPADTAVDDATALTPPDLDLTSRQWARLWSHVRRIDDFWLSLPEIDEGIVAHIAKLAAARRWDVLFITTRPGVRGQTTQIQTQRWLQAHGFALPSVFVVHRSRGAIAQALELDVVVDDRLENCVDVALESKATPVLIRQSAPAPAHRESHPTTVRIVSSIREAVSLVEQIDDDRQRRGVVRSIRKWLGR